MSQSQKNNKKRKQTVQIDAQDNQQDQEDDFDDSDTEIGHDNANENFRDADQQSEARNLQHKRTQMNLLKNQS